MPEKEKIFSSKVKYGEIFNFADYYKFCYDWIVDEGFDLIEDKYVEKLKGDAKEIDVEWTCKKKITDYFLFEVKVKYKVINMKKIEINYGGNKINTNKGTVETAVTGTLIRDYESKFETSGFLKFLRGIYEKWVIPSRVDEFEDKLADFCNDFLQQAKSYLDIEGKK
jgi:hypothetical protein